ncbi:MAG: polyprenyl synthetase family protein [Candidatus Margulisiibacteriota bacterium]
MDMDIYLEEKRKLINEELAKYLPKDDSILSQSMRYSALAPGKRIRAILAIASCSCMGGRIETVLPAACAIEFIHTFSLIHDDLPCMDDDDLRRGLPTNHKKFGQATAVLAADALFALAFEVISSDKNIPARSGNRVILELSRAAGCLGMAKGQSLDMLSEGKKINITDLFEIHGRKTGDLIIASCRTGAVLAGAGEKEISVLSDYAAHLGMAFQIKDDILDVEGTTEEIGKPRGSDIERKKAAFPSILGLEESKKMLSKELGTALVCLRGFDEKARF